MKAKNIIVSLVFLSASIFTFSEKLNIILAEYYPDVYLENVELEGFVIDILNEIEKNSDLTFEITVKNWTNAYNTFLSDKNYDLIGLIAPTPERKDTLKFYKTVTFIDSLIMTRYDNNQTYEELKNYPVGVLDGSFLIDILKNEGFTDIRKYKTNENIISDLLNEKLSSAAIEDERIVSHYIIINNLKPNIRYVKVFDSTPLTFASKKNSKKEEALQIFESTLNKVLKSERFDMIENLWMGISTTLSVEREKSINRMLIVLIIILIGFIVTLVFFYFRSRKMINTINKANTQLRDSYNKISDLSNEKETLSEKLITMYQIFYSFIESEDTKTILNDAIEGLVKLIPEAKTGSIGLVTDHRWEIYAAYGFTEEINSLTLPIDKVIKVGKHVQEVHNLDSYNEDLSVEITNILTKSGAVNLGSSLLMDLYNKERFIGNISVNSKESREFSDISKELMEIFGRLIEIFIDLKFEEREAIDAYNYSLKKLSDVAERFDMETSEHMNRICEISYEIAKNLGLDERFAQEIKTYAYYHDIGKILIPIEILRKKGSLNVSEWEEMKKHPVYGADIIGDAEIFKVARNIALYHQERYNGSGYPYGLKDEEIPIEARIVAVADVYDALRSERPYKKSFSHEESMKILLEGDDRTSPEQFDPKVLKVFVKIAEKFKDMY
ncbi:metal-dependent phosphohydrolase [Petrotoga mexicana DSM 14811]|uniref:Metal-dependent phosphohydrolase n=1 Tax=Petrotoga mexicana DSM 14811 TaxID=1122954 RepID=A0A2K1P666_9BACT|nr:HD domain-containing phosphohydrolase [Petrotoga mexicana]PNR98281.1 metal-dependent phosphohydrolase [Petrotoga mexicana DSM 14811]